MPDPTADAAAISYIDMAVYHPSVIRAQDGTFHEKARKFSHQNLFTYGIGTDLSTAEWRGVVRQLVARGYLEVEGEFSSLRQTETCRLLLRGDPSSCVRCRPKPPARKPAGPPPQRRNSPPPTNSGPARQRNPALAGEWGAVYFSQ